MEERWQGPIEEFSSNVELCAMQAMQSKAHVHHMRHQLMQV